MDMDDPVHLASGGLQAVVAAQGAELQSLRTAGGHELLWQAGPAWPRHAPVLFPIVGRLKDDQLRHEGRAFRLTQHGFARDRRFRLAESGADHARFVLEDDDRTRAMYPFAFRLEIGYRLAGHRLEVSYTVANTGASLLPASIGAHPAFAWPLLPGLGAHRIVFDAEETGPVRRLEDGLLRPDPAPNPLSGRFLELAPELFEHDAIILEAPASRSLRYGLPGGPGLRIGWDGFHQLGIWSRSGAPFLCIEPWAGLASPTGFDGDIMLKPHIQLIAAGDSFVASWTLEAEGMP